MIAFAKADNSPRCLTAIAGSVTLTIGGKVVPVKSWNISTIALRGGKPEGTPCQTTEYEETLADIVSNLLLRPKV